MDTIFSGPAQVEIQGERVLRFRELTQDRAEYQMIGFDKPVITVRDYRPAGLRAISQVLDTGKADDFALQFNVSSHVMLCNTSPSDILIELHETDDSEPAYMLWAAIGIKDFIPVYDYVFDHIEPLDDERFAFLSVYQRPRQCD